MPNQTTFGNKETLNAYYRAYRERNREKLRKYNLKYNKKWRKKNQELLKINRIKTYPRERARAKLRLALKAGIIQRGLCKICRASKVIAYHPNLRYPLKPIWVCRKDYWIVTKNR